MVDKLYMTHSHNRSVEKENYDCKIDLAPWLQVEFGFFVHIFNLRMKKTQPVMP